MSTVSHCTSADAEKTLHADGLDDAGRLCAVKRRGKPDQLPASPCERGTTATLLHLVMFFL